eukprot:SAG22_NODE_18380_length_288_cov_0.947090_1_plen_72_part_10
MTRVGKTGIAVYSTKHKDAAAASSHSLLASSGRPCVEVTANVMAGVRADYVTARQSQSAPLNAEQYKLLSST